MKTFLLTSSLILATTISFAQTPRLSLYEEFTGETCAPCAATNPSLNTLLDSPTNTPNIVAIKWQVPIPTAPSNTWSLYQTDKTEINWRWGSSPAGYGYIPAVTYAPFGKIDGQSQAAFGASGPNVDHPAYMTTAIIDSAHAFTSPFSVVMAKAWDQTMSSLNVTVNVVASQNFTATGALVFRAVMIEKVIQFSVQPGNNGETKFENPARASFPSLQAGTPLTGAWVTGQSHTFTLNCILPSYIVDKNQVGMVGFIQDDGTKKIEQAVRASDCIFKPIMIISNKTTICAGDMVILSTNDATHVVWSDMETNGTIAVTPTITTNYWVMTADTNACPNIAALTVSVNTCTSLKELSTKDVVVGIYPNPNKGEFLIRVDFANEKTRILIFNTLGQNVFEQVLNPGETAVKTHLDKGLYTYQLLQATNSISIGKLLIE